MGSNIKKRIITSIILISLLSLMFFYSYIMIISVIIISIIAWIEFYALISKIFRKNKAKHNPGIKITNEILIKSPRLENLHEAKNILKYI